MVQRAAATAHSEGFAKPTENIVVVAGIPFAQAGTTNNLRVVQVDGRPVGYGPYTDRTGVFRPVRVDATIALRAAMTQDISVAYL